MKKITYEPSARGDAYYRERVDRNIGWILPHEQEILRRSIVGIAGNGGMGGLLCATLLRAGIGELRIADREVFDLSNLNRQFAARRATVGKSKALETAKELRRITDDARIVIYPEGISEETVDDFVSGCDLVLDEIEFFAVGARILLHQRARNAGVPIFNCNTVGFGTRLFFFTPESTTMEELLGFSYEEAKTQEDAVRAGDSTARNMLIERVNAGLLPELPEYKGGDRTLFIKRLIVEGKASIFATNPPLATGFLADRTALYLLRASGVKRTIAHLPEMPGYLYFDAAFMNCKIVRGRWW